MKTHIIEERKRHHAALEALASEVGCTTPGIVLWRKLMRLEKVVLTCCEHYTNETGGVTLPKWERCKKQARNTVAAIFGGTIPAGVFINGDPRGHMLKLDNEMRPIPAGMQTDWGNYGILAATIE